MKQLCICLLMLAWAGSALAQSWQRLSGASYRQSLQLQPQRYELYRQGKPVPVLQHGSHIALPAPDGRICSFRLQARALMHPQLAARYPQLQTFRIISDTDPTVSGSLNISHYGLHAMVQDADGSWFVDPAYHNRQDVYLAYYRHHYMRPQAGLQCLGPEPAGSDPLPQQQALRLNTGHMPLLTRIHGQQHKTYRLALACTGEYAEAVTGQANPAKADVLAKMLITLNRVSGILERELSISLQLVAQTDTLIFTDPQTDPYSNFSASSLIYENQQTTDARIGDPNYDLGHVLSTGGGGLAQLASVCRSTTKAQAVTGQPNPMGDAFDVDFVIHELGHQFGANHTFNNNTSGSCGGHAEASAAFEPGSGTSIMGYAGICGNGNDFQLHSDDYFHAHSLLEISSYIHDAAQGGSCAISLPAANQPPVVAPLPAGHYIPWQTPFELSAPRAFDPDGDSLRYSWEQWDLGDFGASWDQTRLAGPIFRSFPPSANKTRVFPALPMLLQNITSYAGEKLPDVSRSLHFRLTVRDLHQGLGGFNMPDDTLKLQVVQTAAPFRVLSPNAATDVWDAGRLQPIRWEPGGSELPPVSCSHVDVYLSVDGGYTWPYTLATGLPNDGLDSVLVPVLPATADARLKIKGAGNVFFDLSDASFRIREADIRPWPAALQLYPVPTGGMLHIRAPFNQNWLEAAVFNVLGQRIWQGGLTDRLDVDASGWAPGLYMVLVTEPGSGKREARSIVVQRD